MIDVAQNAKKLIHSRIDIAVENVIPFNYELKKLGAVNEVRILPTLLSKSVRYIAFHKNKKGNHLAEKFQRKLDELKRNGTIQLIIKNWHE